MVARSTDACAPTTRANPTSAAAAIPEDRGRDERHVEAGDGQHVIDPGAPEGVVHLARERAALAEEQAGEEGGRALGQRGADLRHRPALHPRGPGREVGGERPHAVRAPAAHERDTLAPELGGIVEAARVPVSHGRMEAQVGRDALALPQGGRFTIDRDERAPGGRPPLRLGHERLDLEQETEAVRCPASRLLRDPRFHGEDPVRSQGADIVRSRGKLMRSERAQ